jgi:hypothetical protein
MASEEPTQLYVANMVCVGVSVVFWGKNPRQNADITSQENFRVCNLHQLTNTKTGPSVHLGCIWWKLSHHITSMCQDQDLLGSDPVGGGGAGSS